MTRFLSSKAYIEWFESISVKEQAILNSRLLRIQEFEHFGDFKYLGKSLFELRWKNGLRVYYSIVKDEEGNVIILLLGGGKSTQARDIKRARKILKDNVEE
jgi:putative addiction module killer protein